MSQNIYKQSYSYNFNDINIKLFSSYDTINKNKNLTISIVITNNSEKDAFVLSKEYLLYAFQANRDVLYISYGDQFYSSLETEIELLIIKKKTSENFIIEVPVKEIQQEVKYKQFFVELGLGIVVGKKRLNKFKHLGTIPICYKDDKVVLSSIVFVFRFRPF